MIPVSYTHLDVYKRQGLFQGIMPLIGYFCGRMFSDAISSIDHWIALILLGVIGLNMIKEAWQESRESECENCGNKTLTLPTILMQAVATSIDALAAVSYTHLDEGKSILISTHIIDMFESLWDDAYILHQGKIVREVRREDLGDQSLKEIFFACTQGEQG